MTDMAELHRTSPRRAGDTLRPLRPQHRKAKDLSAILRSLADAHQGFQERYDTTIHPNDKMFRSARTGGAAEYFGVARAAIASLTAAMALAGKKDVSSILDLPCGYGRVTRMLRARWPGARLAACDLLTEGVDFCAEHFGAAPIYSRPDPAEIPTDERFDLIWSGSLLTHLDAPLWQPFLEFFVDHLEPDGLLVFSTLGRFAALHPPQRQVLRNDHREAMRTAYLSNGFAYMDQTDPRCPWHSPTLEPGNGLMWASPSWVLEQTTGVPDLRVLALWERGWNEHQDLLISVKRAVGAPRQPLVL